MARLARLARLARWLAAVGWLAEMRLMYLTCLMRLLRRMTLAVAGWLADWLIL